MNKSKVKNIALYGVMIALAMIFSYLESFIPINLLIPVPGVKLGLANIVVLFALYTMRFGDAVVIAVIRVLLSGLIFGNPMTIAYSLAGSMLSIVAMYLLKKTDLSIIGVSMMGGISHNIGQLIVAVILTSTVRIAYLVPVLLVTGMVTGLLMGVAAKLVIPRVEAIVKRI
ncbi:MAG: Gx transporter family protein [Eubacteriales bacterium]|nr:Gx transporter family protein [Eubacteriales bacterium]